MNALRGTLLEIGLPDGASAAPPLPPHAGLVGLLYLLLLLVGLAALVLIAVRLGTRRVDWGRRYARLVRRPWQGTDLGQLTLLLIGLHLVLSLLSFAVLRQGFIVDDGPRAVLQSVFFHWTILGFVVIVLRRRRWTINQAFGLRLPGARQRVGQGLLFYLAMLPPGLLIHLFYQWLLRESGYQPDLQEVMILLGSEMSPWLKGYLLLLGIALAPVAEEMLFRGLGFTLLARRFGAPTAVAASAVIFALMHLHIGSFVLLSLLGAAFAAAYLYSGSLLVPIVMHASFNVVNIAVMLLLSA